MQAENGEGVVCKVGGEAVADHTGSLLLRESFKERFELCAYLTLFAAPCRALRRTARLLEAGVAVGEVRLCHEGEAESVGAALEKCEVSAAKSDPVYLHAHFGRHDRAAEEELLVVHLEFVREIAQGTICLVLVGIPHWNCLKLVLHDAMIARVGPVFQATHFNYTPAHETHAKKD
jgi:hypothetical protein